MRKKTAVVWNGFFHRWREENHRMARIGNRIRELSQAEITQIQNQRDFLMNTINPVTGQVYSPTNPVPGFDENADFNYTSTHYAASGSESDTAEYSSYYKSIQSPSEEISFIQGEVNINIRGHEDVMNNGRVTISGTFEPFSTGSNVEGRFFLNGFDIVRTSNQEAKKYHRMRLNFLNETFDAKAGTFSAEIDVDLFATCQSAECWDIFPFIIGGISPAGEGNRMEYDINVSWMFVIGDTDHISFEQRSYSEQMDWPNKDFNPNPDSLFMSDFQRQDTVPVKSNYPVMCPGFTSMEYELTKTGGHIHQLSNERSFHMLELGTYIKAVPGVNHHTVDYLMFFKNWKDIMGHSTAYGVGGEAEFNVDVCYMHFKDPNTIVQSHEKQGDFRWETKHGSNSDPNSPNALETTYFNLNNLLDFQSEEKTLSLIPNSNDYTEINLAAMVNNSEVDVEVDFSQAPAGTSVHFSSELFYPLRFVNMENFYPVNHYLRNHYLFVATKERGSTALLKDFILKGGQGNTLNFTIGVNELPFLNSSNHFYDDGYEVIIRVKRFGIVIHEQIIKLRFFISPYVGNKNAKPCKELHLFGCEWEMKMSAHNRVPFNTIADAHADNYDNGHNCLGGSTC